VAKFVVAVKAVYIHYVEVEANSKDEAKKAVSLQDRETKDLGTAYSHPLDPKYWDVYRPKKDKQPDTESG